MPLGVAARVLRGAAAAGSGPVLTGTPGSTLMSGGSGPGAVVRSGSTFSIVYGLGSVNAGFGRWAPDGSLLAAGPNTPTGPIYTWTRNGGTVAAASTYALPSDFYPFHMAWSGDAQYLAACNPYATTNNLIIFRKTGTTLQQVLLATGANKPMRVAFSPDGTLLAVGTQRGGEAALKLFAWNGTALTALADPAVQPVGQCTGLEWSPDGQNLVHCNPDSSPFVRAYKRNGDTLDSITVPSLTNNARHVAWAPDSAMLVITTTNTAGIALCRRDSPTQLSYLGNLPVVYNTTPYTADWSGDGLYLTVSYQNNSSYAWAQQILQRTSATATTMTTVADQTQGPVGAPWASWHPYV